MEHMAQQPVAGVKQRNASLIAGSFNAKYEQGRRQRDKKDKKDKKNKKNKESLCNSV